MPSPRSSWAKPRSILVLIVFFVFLKPGLAFALYFQGFEKHVLYGLEPAAMQSLNERLDFRFISIVTGNTLEAIVPQPCRSVNPGW